MTTIRPELLGATFDQANSERKTAQQERIKQAAQKTTGDVLPEGRPSNSAICTVLTAEKRAGNNGVSPRTQKKLDRLARDRPDLLAEVQAGTKSANRAAIEAGIVRVPSLYEQAKKAADRLNNDDLAALVKHCQERLQQEE